MFKVGQTVKTRLGFNVHIIAVLDVPATDGKGIVGVREISHLDREIETYWPDGRYMSRGDHSCNDILPLPEIQTRHVYPPIPQRQFDWCAWWSDSDEDDPRRGWGPTEQSAIAELKEMFPREEHKGFRLIDGEVQFK